MSHCDLSNPRRLSFNAFLDDIAIAMFTAWRSGAVVEYYLDRWYTTTSIGELSMYGIYRVRPGGITNQLIVPWKLLAPWIKVVVMNSAGRCWGLSAIPERDAISWIVHGMIWADLSMSIIIDTTGVNWKKSLTLRPGKKIRED